jgi:hypothetical protein
MHRIRQQVVPQENQVRIDDDIAFFYLGEYISMPETVLTRPKIKGETSSAKQQTKKYDQKRPAKRVVKNPYRPGADWKLMRSGCFLGCKEYLCRCFIQ